MDEFSWIDEESKINEIKDFTISPEIMSSISVHIVYINTHLEIEDRIVQTVPLEQTESAAVLSKEQLLYLVQNNKMFTPKTQYKFMMGLIYNVDVLPAYLQQFVKDPPAGGGFLKEFCMVDDIRVPPSLHLFHSVNAIYLFFIEEDLKKMRLIGAVSITAKMLPELERVDKKTKRVRIAEEKEMSPSLKTAKNKTQKKVRIIIH
jgi:hypothetical protein